MMACRILRNLSFVRQQLSTTQSHVRQFHGTAKLRNASSKMAPLTINSKIRMNSGYEIPVVGYGVGGNMSWEGSHADHDPTDVCQAVVEHALKTGYRHIDSAVAYRNEGPCGVAMKTSELPREEVFFTSKIRPLDLSYENTKEQVDATLKVTGLDYVDLMLIHSPYGKPDGRKGAWKALVEAQEEGKVRSIGVSNYGVHHLDELETYIKELEKERGAGKGGVLSVGQWELHPWLERPDIVEWCQKRGVILEAYCPLVRGLRFHEKNLKLLVAKYEKTPAQVLLRWSLQKGFVPLPKSVTPTRIDENADVFDFELTEEDMKILSNKEYAPCSWDPTLSPLDA